MTQDEHWLLKYKEVVAFIESNKRNPSKRDDEERGLYLIGLSIIGNSMLQEN